jgi:predicted ferric reductase
VKYTLTQRLFWVLAFLGLATLPMVVAVTGDSPEGRHFWIEFGVMLGFLGFGILAIQFVITGRFRWFAAGFGLDNILQFHRQTGIFAWVLVFAHPIILLVYDRSFLEYFDPRVNAPRAWALGFIMVATPVLVASTLWRLAFGLSYERWRLVHGLLSCAILLLGLGHIVMVDVYSEPLWKKGAFSLIGMGAIYLLVHSRVVRPWRMRRVPYRVKEVRAERGDACTLVMEPDGHPGMAYRAGQFAWITIGDSAFSMQQHPYSFSSGETSRALEFTVKALGDFSSGVKHLSPGTRAFLEGPYGAFTFTPGMSQGALFVAGGVGITPIMSMLRTFRDRGEAFPMVLFYANKTWDGIIFREEIERMSETMPIQVVHVLEEPPAGWKGERGFITREILDRYLPKDPARYTYFICGPAPMMDVAEAALKENGIGIWSLYSERFGMV